MYFEIDLTGRIDILKGKKMIQRVKIFVFIISIFLTSTASLQIPRALEIPKLSQKSQVLQRIGFTDIIIEYHSPATRGRDIWGSRIIPKNGKPFPWRAGANENTKISFTDSVMIQGKKIKAGVYGMHIIPSETEATIIFSNNSTSWGSFFYNINEDALRVTVKKQKIPHREWLTYDFEVREKNHAIVALKWADVKIPFEIRVDEQTTLNHIRNQLRSDAAFTSDGWSNAAKYCLTNGVNYSEGLLWIENALKNDKSFNNFIIKANLLVKSGKKENLDEVKRALMKASTPYDIYSYIYRNKEKDNLNIIEELNTYNLKTNPKTWEANYGSGIYYLSVKSYKNAIKYFEKALKYVAPESNNLKKAILRDMEKAKKNL